MRWGLGLFLKKMFRWVLIVSECLFRYFYCYIYWGESKRFEKFGFWKIVKDINNMFDRFIFGNKWFYFKYRKFYLFSFVFVVFFLSLNILFEVLRVELNGG